MGGWFAVRRRSAEDEIGRTGRLTGRLCRGSSCGQSRLHSAKTVSEDAWQHDRIELLPLNPDYAPLIAGPHEGPEMAVVGEWVASIE